jgi:hypothetical protein
MDVIGQNQAPAEPRSPFVFRHVLDVTVNRKSLALAGILTSNRPVRSLFAIPSTALEKGGSGGKENLLYNTRLSLTNISNF